MKRSVGEMRAEVLKAGRGVGLPLGVAEDLAAAVTWMDGAALDELADLFDLPDGVAQITDIALHLDQRAAGQQPSDASVAALWTALWTALTACQDGADPDPARRDIPDVLWARFGQCAARIYVPETELSRARGAGAGNIDND